MENSTFHEDDLKMVPHSVEAEEGFLGAAILNPGGLDEIAIHDKQFFIHRNGWICKAILKLHKKDSLDYLTLVDELEAQGHLAEIGGIAYITRLINNCPSAMNMKAYADIIVEKYNRRVVLEAANGLAKRAYDEGKDIDVADAINELHGLIVSGGHRAEHWGDALYRTQERVYDRMNNPSDVWGLSFGNGFGGINKATGGAQPGTLYLLAGPPGVGKSILMADWLAAFASQQPGAFYSSEMPEEDFLLRVMAAQAGIENRKMESGKIGADEFSYLTNIVEDLKEKSVYFSDFESWDTAALRADLTRLKRLHGIRWVMFDYLGLFEDASEDMTELTAVAAKNFRKMCRALDLAGILACSVVKEGMERDTKPTLKMLRGSGQVLHEGDVVFWLHPYFPNPNDQDELRAKSRYGESLRTLFSLKGRKLAHPLIYLHLRKGDEVTTMAEVDWDNFKHGSPLPKPYTDRKLVDF